jgi:ribonucleoside-diphosphate reductase alpha chain
MKVVKRDGSIEEFDAKKIKEYTEVATQGLNVNVSDLEIGILSSIRDGIKTSDIQKSLITLANSLIDVDSPDWDKVATKLYIHDLYHRVKVVNKELSYEYYVKYGLNYKLLHKSFSNYDIKKLSTIIKPERDFDFTSNGIINLDNRYIIKDKYGNPIETPQFLFLSIAIMLAQGDFDTTKRYYDLLSTKKGMLATPSLSNVRKPYSQGISCFVGVSGDSIESIFDSYRQIALGSKYGGGFGWDFTNIRATGSSIDNNKNAASGVIPFLKNLDSIVLSVDQLGVRKGSVAPSLELWHYDILDYLDLRVAHGDDNRRAFNLDIAVSIPSLFFKKLRDNDDWYLFDPKDTSILHEVHGDDFELIYNSYANDDNIRKKIIPAIDLWKTILTRYYEDGHPFIMFKDEVNNRNQNNHSGYIYSLNLCQEIAQNTSPSLTVADEDINGYKLKSVLPGEVAVCNLASVNLGRVTSMEDLKETTQTLVEMVNAVIDINFYPFKEAYLHSKSYRSIGIGVAGLHHYLAKKGLIYGGKDALEEIDKLFEHFSYYAIEKSIDLTEKYGSYKHYKGSNWSLGILPIDTSNYNADSLVVRESDLDWGILREKVVEKGIANGYIMAIAPTVSISTIMGTTPSIEPIYSRLYYENNLLGSLKVVVPDLNLDTYSYYQSAFDIDQIGIVKTSAIIQKWIDQSISTNLFINDSNGTLLSQYLLSGYKYGLKSIYYLRTKSSDVNECTVCQ